MTRRLRVDFAVNMIVFAKVSGWRPWPARVSKIKLNFTNFLPEVLPKKID